VCFQTAELGKVDQGARNIAHMCANTAWRCWTPGFRYVHARALEIVSKADLYETLRALRAFLTQA
jgi:aspartyl aminopeptidase